MSEDNRNISSYQDLGRYIVGLLAGTEPEDFNEPIDCGDIADVVQGMIEAHQLDDDAEYDAMNQYQESIDDLSERLQVAEAGWAGECAKVAALTTRAEAAEQRAEAAEGRATASAGAALAVAHACEATRRRVLEEVIDLLDTRAVQRSAQTDIAQANNGAWEVVAGKSSELMAVADLLRQRLPPSAGSATS